MTYRSVLGVVVFATFCFAQQNPQTGTTPPQSGKAAAANREDYRIGAGDVLDVNVWKEPDASASSVLVRTDGKITLPFIKDVDAAGRTPVELEKALAERFSKLIPQAEVTVVVRESHSQKVYVIGAVKKEGAIEMQHPITVLQVLSLAGGLTEFAKRKKVYVLRNTGQKQEKIPFNYDAVLKGDQNHQDFLVEPGDIVVVPH